MGEKKEHTKNGTSYGRKILASQISSARDENARSRDNMAQSEDANAEIRDLQARQRDVSSNKLDDRADTSDLENVVIHAASDRTDAAADRSRSSMDRTRSKQDRTDAATDRKHATEERHAAVFDDLTGAYRRGVGLAELQRAILQTKRTGEPLVVAYIDVDGLKTINDTYGHTAGDNVLCSVAKALRDQLREYDLIIRMGGDEFVSVIVGMTVPMVKIRFATINAELLALPEQGSISSGIAQLEANESMEELIARADTTLLDDRKLVREANIQGVRIHR